MASNPVLPMFSLKDKTAIVSGAGSAIGVEIAHALAEAGANVAMLYLSNKKTIEFAKQIADTYKVQCTAYQLDVTKEEDVEAVIDCIVADFGGRLDVFIANSGIAWDEIGAIDSSLKHYHEVISTNMDSVYYCARIAGRHWRRQATEKTTIDGKSLLNFKSGSFVANASMSAHIVNYPHIQTAYNASKAGVIHMCKSLAVEWTGFARANTVSPGFVEAGLTGASPEDFKEYIRGRTPMRRIGDPYELKGAFLYLASEASSYCTGTDIICDGGFTLW